MNTHLLAARDAGIGFAVFVVWGPTAEWGDGSGPLAFGPTQEWAEADIEWRKGEDADYLAEVRSEDPSAPVPWPYDSVDYSIDGPTPNPRTYFEIPDEVWNDGIDAVFEWLNIR